MAVRKPEPSDSNIDERMPADAVMSVAPPAAMEPAVHNGGNPTEAFDSDPSIWNFNLYLMRSGAALLVAFELGYFILDIYLLAPLTSATAALHSGAVGLAALVLALTMSNWFERNWRPVCFANLVAIYGLTLALRLLTGDIPPLFITLVFTLIGTGALLRWSAGWQAGLSAITLSIAVLSGITRRRFGPQATYRYLSVALAIALGHFILAMRERHRAELAAWMDRLRTSHRALAGALAESAAIMAEREIAERRLREGEAMLRTVFDAAPDNIAITRMSDGATLEVNREFLKTGYTREEILGVAAIKMGRWSRPQQRELVRQLRQHGAVRNFETELRNKDGKMVPSLVSATIVELGGEQCVISIARDITELQRTQRELTSAREALAVELRELEVNRRQLVANEDKLRKVLEATGDTITVSRLKDGHYLDVNQAFCDMTGYTREEALGRSAIEMGIWSYPEQLQNLLRLLKTGKRVRDLECTFRMKDGRLADHMVSASLIRLDGETCIVGATRNVSALKRTEREVRAARAALAAQVHELEASQSRLRSEMAERELAQHRLQDSEKTLRRIFEASLDAITVKRVSDGRYVDVNKEFEVFGYSREEALGKNAEELGIWADHEQLEAFSQRVKLEGRVRNSESLCRTRDGRIIPSLVSAVAVELGGEQCVVSFVREISVLKQTERELIAAREGALAASEAKSHFLSVMSHEIRTPMNAIFGMADLLWETSLTAEQRRYLETMRNNSTSLLNLVNGILDLSKVESGRLSLEHANFDLVELAEDVMETLGVRAHEKGLELALHIPATFPTALIGDPLRLRQILMNLLGNAIKFTERGEVMLTIEAVKATEAGLPSAAQPGEASAAPSKPKAAPSSDASAPAGRQLLHFVVRDTGIGIPIQQQEAIFANFTQADLSISRKYGGSGLGLAIVKRLVELMNGRITVKSRPREGSTFSFTIAFELQPAAATAPLAPAAATRLAGKKVLVVDNSAASRTVLDELLALTGAEVFAAADGAGALSELARAREAGRPYDAIVADNQMPDPDGAAIAQQIMRASDTPREAIVLMLTANDLTSQLGRLRERGLEESQGCRYLLKPVRRAELWATLAAACAGAIDERASRNGADTASVIDRGASPDSYLRRAAPHRAAMVVKRPLRILLVEDSPDNRLLVEAYLKDTPYQLDHAENGRIAVCKFMTGHYDAVLMDIQMPVMDGYEAVAEIRRLEQSDHRRPTPIIALTASATDEAIRRSLKMGCDAHVTKPIKRSTLLETIREAVEPAPQGAPAASGAEGAAVVSDQPIVVEIDQDLRDLVPGFLGRKGEDAQALRAAVEHGDAEAIARLGHKMKGEGGSYGLDAITDIGRDLEQAGKDKDFEAARRLARDLTNFLERLEIVYRPVEE